MLAVNKAEYVGGYKIHLFFNNEKDGVADLEKVVFNDRREIFSELKEKSNFVDFKIDHDTVVWSNELDLAPEYLFYLSFIDDESLQGQFKRWGYVA
ncbi:MAG: DUF2442 domain-containing protein [Gammaproteobacteria bacterium]|nr:DUF2442 domain-containing protein [Gammaproteobacteria bacterium]